MTTFAMITLGCKVNSYESQGYIENLKAKGYQEVDAKDIADVYIINTCTVTNVAASKSRQKVHQAKTRNKQALIVVVGCYAQTRDDSDIWADIDLCIGSSQKAELANFIEAKLRGDDVHIPMIEAREINTFEALPIHAFNKQTRAYLKIQDGCNQFCSYCIIPYARGKERSLPLDQVIETANNLSNTHLEIVLTGIHTGRYGVDLQTNLLELLKQIVTKVKKIERIRISSIEMNEITDEFIAYMKQEKKIARHLHIPIQSANDRILKEMNRPYDVAWFKARVAKIKKEIPDISISTDVIVGFPSESDEEFMETYQNLEDMKLSFLHVFPYSKRSNTKAATMQGHLNNDVKKQRVHTLLALSNKLYVDYKKAMLGKAESMIVEKVENDYVFGHTSTYIPVYMLGGINDIHKHIAVSLDHIDEDRLIVKRKGDENENFSVI